jgi:hypothetical protein
MDLIRDSNVRGLSPSNCATNSAAETLSNLLQYTAAWPSVKERARA